MADEGKVFPVLTEWVRATDVATMLGVSRQRINKMIHDPDSPFTTVHIITAPEELGVEDRRPLFVIQRDEVEAVVAQRRDRAEAKLDS